MSESNVCRVMLKALALNIRQRHVAGIGADIEAFELLRLVGRLRRRPDRDLLARGKLVEVLAEVSGEILLGGLLRDGRRRGETDHGEAEGSRRDKTQGDGGHGLHFAWLWGHKRQDRLASRSCPQGCRSLEVYIGKGRPMPQGHRASQSA
jgi:hypothetical protein